MRKVDTSKTEGELEAQEKVRGKAWDVTQTQMV